jgi:hypothetical protein
MQLRDPRVREHRESCISRWRRNVCRARGRGSGHASSTERWRDARMDGRDARSRAWTLERSESIARACSDLCPPRTSPASARPPARSRASLRAARLECSGAPRSTGWIASALRDACVHPAARPATRPRKARLATDRAEPDGPRAADPQTGTMGRLARPAGAPFRSASLGGDSALPMGHDERRGDGGLPADPPAWRRSDVGRPANASASGSPCAETARARFRRIAAHLSGRRSAADSGFDEIAMHSIAAGTLRQHLMARDEPVS